MTNTEAAIQLKSLQAQLNVLEARLRSEQKEPAKDHSFAELFGWLKNETSITDADIDASLYRARDDRDVA